LKTPKTTFESHRPKPWYEVRLIAADAVLFPVDATAWRRMHGSPAGEKLWKIYWDGEENKAGSRGTSTAPAVRVHIHIATGPKLAAR
jgi:hypothetical protein